MRIIVRTLSSKTVNARSRFQSTALDEACMEGYEGLANLLQQLLQHGADVYARDKELENE